MSHFRWIGATCAASWFALAACGRGEADDVAATAADASVDDAGDAPSLDASLDGAGSTADAEASVSHDASGFDAIDAPGLCPKARPASGDPCAPEGLACSWPGDCVAVWTCQNGRFTCYGSLREGEACDVPGTQCDCTTGCSCSGCTCEPDGGASSWSCFYCPC